MPGFKSSWTGILTESDIVEYLQNQSVMVFPSTADRDGDIASVEDGMMAFTLDTPNVLWLRTAVSGWVPMWSEWAAHPSPTWASGVSAGNGTFTAAYRYEGGSLHLRGQFELGSTSTVSGSPQLNLPLSFSPVTYPQAGAAWIRDDNTNTVYSCIAQVGIGFTTLVIRTGDGTNISASSPFTWATGDLISWDIVVSND